MKKQKTTIGIVPYILVNGKPKYFLVKQNNEWKFPTLDKNFKSNLFSDTPDFLRDFEFEHIVFLKQNTKSTKYYLTNFYNKKFDLFGLDYDNLKLFDYEEALTLLSSPTLKNLLLSVHNILVKKDL